MSTRDSRVADKTFPEVAESATRLSSTLAAGCRRDPNGAFIVNHKACPNPDPGLCHRLSLPSSLLNGPLLSGHHPIVLEFRTCSLYAGLFRNVFPAIDVVLHLPNDRGLGRPRVGTPVGTLATPVMVQFSSPGFSGLWKWSVVQYNSQHVGEGMASGRKRLSRR